VGVQGPQGGRCILGVDPGRSGGAALLSPDAREVWGTWAWVALERKTGRVYRVESWLRTYTAPIPACYEATTMYQIGMMVTSDVQCLAPAPPVVAVEGLFVPRSATAQSVIPLAELTGEMIGALHDLGPPAYRPMASVWRTMLGRGHRDAKSAESAATLYAGRRWRHAPLLCVGAVAEAACIAVWAWGERELARGRVA
jgi:hypothetical protein